MPNGHRKPWDGTRTKSGEITATAAWKRVGAKVLKRDRNERQLRLPGCTGHATQVDHILNVAAGGPELDPTNLVSACLPCNARKAQKEAAAARNRWKRQPEKHPGLRW